MDRLIVLASNSVVLNGAATPPTKTTTYTIFIFRVNGTQAVTPFSSFSVPSVLEDTNSQMKVFVSPSATKLMLFYNKTDGTQGIAGKHIDYGSETAIDLQFQNQTNFIESIKGINLPGEMAFGDNFMVVRNGSLFRLYDLEKRALEVAYQFLGSQVRFLKSRDLSANFTIGSTYNDTSNNNYTTVCTNNTNGTNTTNGTNQTCTKVYGAYRNHHLSLDK